MKNSYFKSLRFRLFTWFLVIGIVPLILLKGILIPVYENRAVEVRTMDIQEQCKILSNQMVTADYLNTGQSDVINANLVQLTNVYDARVYVVDRSFRIVKDTYLIGEGKTAVADDVLSAFSGTGSTKYSKENKYIQIAFPVRNSSGEVEGVILVQASAGSILGVVDMLESKGLLIQVALSAIILVLSLIASVILVKPLGNIAFGVDCHGNTSCFRINVCSNNGRLRKSHCKVLRRHIVRKHIYKVYITIHRYLIILSFRASAHAGVGISRSEVPTG